MTEKYVWMRREGETPASYDYFRTYLEMGSERTLVKLAAKRNRSREWMEQLSSQNKWVERARAFDNHVTAAETDGMVHQLVVSRDGNLELVRKLRELLSKRLDHFIKEERDPTAMWNQALCAMVKVEQSVFNIKEDQKTTDLIDRLEEKVAKALGLEA